MRPRDLIPVPFVLAALALAVTAFVAGTPGAAPAVKRVAVTSGSGYSAVAPAAATGPSVRGPDSR